MAEEAEDVALGGAGFAGVGCRGVAEEVGSDVSDASGFPEFSDQGVGAAAAEAALLWAKEDWSFSPPAAS